MANGSRRVWISGGTGYVGSKLADMLVAEGWSLRIYDTEHFGNSIEYLRELGDVEFIVGDIRDASAVKASMHDCTDVIHLAGVVTDELVDMNPGFGAEVNLYGTASVAAAARDTSTVERLLYASSSSVYGEAATGDVPPTEQTVPIPQTEYARQKLEGESIVNAVKSEKLAVVSVRQATACGPAPRMRLDTVVNIFSYQAYFNGVITPYGGSQYRSNVYVGDAARFYEFLLRYEQPQYINGTAWNLANHNKTVMEIAEDVQRAYHIWEGRSHVVKIEPVDIEDARSYKLDGSGVQNMFNFRTRLTVAGAALENFDHFRKTGLNPEDPIYFNNRRMADIVKGA